MINLLLYLACIEKDSDHPNTVLPRMFCQQIISKCSEVYQTVIELEMDALKGIVFLL